MADTTKPLRDDILEQDIKSFRGAKTIPDYAPSRPEASLETISEIDRELQSLYDLEVQARAQHKAIQDKIRAAEWRFHDAVQAMKTSVVAQFGKNSDQAEWVGYKKPEDYKKPKRKSDEPDDSNNK
jgi:hypothetical protein